MTIPFPRRDDGIALIVVMIVILVLGTLAGGFAYSMKVETKLASNTSLEPDLEWLGRSGVEMARYLVGQQLTLTPGVDALNQKWAGGPGNTNDVLAGISLTDNQLGAGKFSVKIIDAERRFNINQGPSNPVILQTALQMMGVDATDSSTIVDSVRDWLDPDDDSHLSGAESDDYYLQQNPPYFAKNGPIGDMSELLLIRGITPEMYWGSGAATNLSRAMSSSRIGNLGFMGASSFTGGLVDLFTTMGGPLVNINTASSEVLQMIGLPPDVAASIVVERAGFDGAAGTQDDQWFTTTDQLVRWLPPPAAQLMKRYATTRSAFFEVQVDAQVAQYKRRFKAMLWRNTPRDVQLLYLYSE